MMILEPSFSQEIFNYNDEPFDCHTHVCVCMHAHTCMRACMRVCVTVTFTFDFPIWKSSSPALFIIFVQLATEGSTLSTILNAMKRYLKIEETIRMLQTDYYSHMEHSVLVLCQSNALM